MIERPDDTAGATTEEELVITRHFDAPRELVFRAWTDAEHLARWWGPKDFTNPVCETDPRPGGRWFICMQWPDGRKIWCGGEYREVDPPERIVATDCFLNEDRELVDPIEHYDMPEGTPAEMLMTITFEEHEGGTKMTLHQSMDATLAREAGAYEGWGQSFDKLDEYLAKVGG